MAERDHDIVLFGATGFTGALTAEYLARHAPDGLRWALAGRNRAKLEALSRAPRHRRAAPARRRRRRGVAALGRRVGARGDHDRRPVRRLRRAAGRRLRRGRHRLRRPDRRAGVRRPHVRAATTTRPSRSGARIVHACGFDSIPHDLGVLFTVQQLPEGVPLNVRGFVRAGGRPSGGTFHSAMTAFSRVRQTQQAHKERRPGGAPRERAPRAAARPSRTASSATGPCRCRRSTRRSSRAPRAPSSATARTSPTATTPASSGSRSPSAAWRASPRCSSPPRSRRCARPCWAG